MQYAVDSVFPLPPSSVAVHPPSVLPLARQSRRLATLHHPSIPSLAVLILLCFLPFTILYFFSSFPLLYFTSSLPSSCSIMILLLSFDFTIPYKQIIFLLLPVVLHQYFFFLLGITILYKMILLLFLPLVYYTDTSSVPFSCPILILLLSS